MPEPMPTLGEGDFATVFLVKAQTRQGYTEQGTPDTDICHDKFKAQKNRMICSLLVHNGTH